MVWGMGRGGTLKEVEQLVEAAGGGSDSEVSEDTEAPLGSAAEPLPMPRARHHCTDGMCLLLFAVAIGGLVFVLNYAALHGDFQRLSHGFNFMGKICGIDVPEPYLYWCSGESAIPSIIDVSALDLAHPTCVSSCPVSNTTNHACYQTLTGSLVAVPDYPTRVFAGRFCMPVDSYLTAQVHHSPVATYLLEVSQITKAWLPLAVCFTLAILLGYVFLLFLHVSAGYLMWTSMYIMVVVPTIGGAYLLSASVSDGVDGIPHTGDSKWDEIIGTCLVLLGTVFFLISCCRRRSIDMAIGCLEAACECMFDMPSLLLEPLVTVLMKGSVQGAMLVGLLWLLSCGQIKDNDVSKTFEYTDAQKMYIGFYIFMMIWVAEILNSLSHFVLAYAVQLWYFTPYVRGAKKTRLPLFAVFKGYGIGTWYHLGTLAFGALIIAIVRAFRMALAYAAKISEDTGNILGACVAKVFLCCLTCFQRCLEFMNKNAYMDVALNSANFCTAAKRSMTVLSGEATAVTALQSACWMFQLAGLGMITGIGTLLFWFMVRRIDAFSNKYSEQYVYDPIVLSLVAAFLCFSVARVFMIVFDTVSCTILYCFAVEKKTLASRLGEDKGIDVSDSDLEPRSMYFPQLEDPRHRRAVVDRRCTPPTLSQILKEQTT